MLHSTKRILVILILNFAASCSKKVVPLTEKKETVTSAYFEDLSIYRKEFENSPDSDPKTDNGVATTTAPMYVNDKVEAILARRTEKNKAIKYANGYRIQLYVGRERKLVDEAKIFIYQNHPTLNPYLSYSLPIYKLKVGDFITKTDAERVLNQLKGSFPDAILVPEKIDVKKSFLRE